jgi:RNA polymerase sigma-70 factor (ECF subfamily)
LDDKTIIQHYWERDERAISETAEKYGAFCFSIAENILHDREDSNECVNETYLKTWNSIPPHKPKVFPAFIGRIVRNLSYNRYNMSNALKRGGGQTEIVLSELEEAIPDNSIDVETDMNELKEAIESFLDTLSERNRKIFVRRYWLTESIGYIAVKMNMSENSVSAVLKRIRRKMRKYLIERGFDV